MNNGFSTQDRHFTGEFGVVELNALVDTRAGLEAALRIAIIEHRSATHYSIAEGKDGGNQLVLMWSSSEGGLPLPFPLESAVQMTDFVASWLAANGKWPKTRPDTDGDVHRGFRIESEDNGWSYALACITPEWTVYGK